MKPFHATTRRPNNLAALVRFEGLSCLGGKQCGRSLSLRIPQRTEAGVRVTALSLLKVKDCVNWHLWNQLIQRCPYCRGRDSLEPIELSLIYRGARTIEFFAGRGFTRVKGTDQRHNRPQYKGICIIEVNTVRSLGEGRERKRVRHRAVSVL